MRITFVLPHAPLAGGTRVVLIYARELKARGHEIKLVTPPQALPGRRARLRMLLGGKFPLRKPLRYDPFDSFGQDHIVADYKRPEFASYVPDADVIVATWWETAFSVMALPHRKGRKVYFVQGHEVHSHLPAHITAGTYYLPMKKIAVSGWLRDAMRDLYGDGNVSVVRNSVDHARFHAEPRRRQPSPTIGFMYSGSAFKGADMAAKALESVRREVPDLRVVSFGKQDARPGRELPENTVYFRQPPQERLRDIYAMCDGWLMPSYSEGFALPVLEAMACRTPVISTRTGIAPDIIRNGTNGYLVDPGDAEEMAHRIVDLLALDQTAWSEMSEAAHVHATSRTWQDAADEFEALLLAEAEQAGLIRTIG